MRVPPGRPLRSLASPADQTRLESRNDVLKAPLLNGL